MTRLTDDEIGLLLTETFTAHEHLADPDRARALIAGGSAPRPRGGRALLAAAASVALVVGGTSYLVSGRGDGDPSAGAHSHGPSRPTTPVPTDTGVTRAQAAAAASRAIAQVPVFPGAEASNADGVPELTDPPGTGPAAYTVTRSRWWTVSGSTPSAVAHWYAEHPARGFVADGGRGSTSGTGSPTIEFVTFHQPGAPAEVVTPVGVRIALKTTTTSAGVGIRATVESVWSPPRAQASFARDVTSIDVLRTTTRFGPQVRSTNDRWTITDPAQLGGVVTAFNRLYGSPPFSVPCPMILSQVEYRVVFRSPHSDLVARISTGCGGGVRVSRDGTMLPPALAALPPLVQALDAAR
jgi:hypothetical protein